MKRIACSLLVSGLLFFVIGNASAQSKDKDRKKFEGRRYKPGKEKKANRNYKAHSQKIEKHKQTTAREKQKKHEKKLKTNKGQVETGKKPKEASDEN